MTRAEEFELQQRGPRSYEDAKYIRNAFCSCISRALGAMLVREQAEWLAESDKWRVWLPETLVWQKAEIRRLELDPDPITIDKMGTFHFPKPDR